MSDPNSEAASCSPSGGYKFPCHIYTECVSLSLPADITLHSSYL
ncbi:UNVERIFIED_CONTAM: hypothetical protein NCL1_09906 [Trichonephila clavipes]